MEALLLLLIFPVLWPFIAKFIFKHELTILEMSANIVITCVVVFVGWHISRYVQTSDYEVWNGQVVSKNQEKVSCEHSYSCNCREVCSGSGQNRSCSTQCDTCYDHSHDFDWNLVTTIGKIKIERVDKQGVNTPTRWSVAQAGQPVAKTHKYDNYIKAVPESIFFSADKNSVTKFTSLIPAYPLGVYDYHYLNRVIPMGLNVPNIAQWNTNLAYALRDLGPLKQANVVIVIVKTDDVKYSSALNTAWLGGKKNDVVVVLGVTEYPKIAWTDVLSWTDNQLFKIQLRDNLSALKELDADKVISVIHDNVAKDFKRKSMADFEYLRDSIEPSSNWIWFLGILSLLMSVGLSILFSRIDLDEMVGLKRRSYYR